MSPTLKHMIKNNEDHPFNYVISPKWKNLTNMTKYWSYAVRIRDGNICKLCDSKKWLTAHHILYQSHFPEFKFLVSNGITLCKHCHRDIHKSDKPRHTIK